MEAKEMARTKEPRLRGKAAHSIPWYDALNSRICQPPAEIPWPVAWLLMAHHRKFISPQRRKPKWTSMSMALQEMRRRAEW
eukprot:3795646-Amphidinium_carterae.1